MGILWCSLQNIETTNILFGSNSTYKSWLSCLWKKRNFRRQKSHWQWKSNIKGILWDRQWSPPSIRIVSHKCWFFFNRNAFLIMKLSRKAGFQVSEWSEPNCFIIDVWNINCRYQQFISYFLIIVFFVSHCTAFYTSSVVFWDVIFWE